MKKYKEKWLKKGITMRTYQSGNVRHVENTRTATKSAFYTSSSCGPYLSNVFFCCLLRQPSPFSNPSSSLSLLNYPIKNILLSPSGNFSLVSLINEIKAVFGFEFFHRLFLAIVRSEGSKIFSLFHSIVYFFAKMFLFILSTIKSLI